MEHRHNAFRHVYTMHHTKTFAGFENKPVAGLGREGSLVLDSGCLVLDSFPPLLAMLRPEHILERRCLLQNSDDHHT